MGLGSLYAYEVEAAVVIYMCVKQKSDASFDVQIIHFCGGLSKP